MRPNRKMALIVSLCLLCGCGGERSLAVVKIDGSSTVFPITEAVAEEFQKANPNIRVTVGISGTGGGFKKLAAGEIDLCDASRAITSEEIEACEAAGMDPLQLVIAIDGIAVVVNPENDWVDELTVDQLKEIWRPESGIHLWSDLNPGWPSEEINLYAPGTDSGTFDYFTSTIVGQEKESRSDFTASEDDNVIVRGVEADRYALGYFGFAYYETNQDRLKVLAINSENGPVRPSSETIRSKAYVPLSRPLFIYIANSSLARSEVVTFADFYLDHVSALSAEVGYIPVEEEVLLENRRRVNEANATQGLLLGEQNLSVEKRLGSSVFAFHQE